MAAFLEARVPELVDLSRVRVEELEPLLGAETRVWREEMDWDFQASADLVRRFVEARSLSGYALVVGEELVGYSYYVAEEHKGLIGDLFVVEEFRTAENEHRLIGAVLEALMRTRRVRRVESQLMLFRSARQGVLPGAQYLRAYERNFMMLELARASELPPKALWSMVLFDRWTERRQEETAQLIAAAYRGHIDSQINDQYRSLAGARRFLFNIVQYPGCGTFFQPASWVAIERDTGRLCGACLSSLVARDVGHITQVCVAPSIKGTGVGYELLRRALESLAGSGANKVSLTVTVANRGPVLLYERMGFRVARQFPALVWEGF